MCDNMNREGNNSGFSSEFQMFRRLFHGMLMNSDYQKDIGNVKLETSIALMICNSEIQGKSIIAQPNDLRSIDDDHIDIDKFARELGDSLNRQFEMSSSHELCYPYYNIAKFMYETPTFSQLYMKWRESHFLKYQEYTKNVFATNTIGMFESLSKKAVEMFMEDGELWNCCGFSSNTFEPILKFFVAQLMLLLNQICREIQGKENTAFIQKESTGSCSNLISKSSGHEGKTREHPTIWDLMQHCHYIEENINKVMKMFPEKISCSEFDWRLRLHPFIPEMLAKLREDLITSIKTQLQQERECATTQILPETTEIPEQFGISCPRYISSSARKFAESVKSYAEIIKSCIGPLKVVEISFFEILHQYCLEISIHNDWATSALSHDASPEWLYILLGSTYVTRQATQSIFANKNENSLRSIQAAEKVLEEKIICYHKRVLSTLVLHDDESNNWTSTKPFFENEICSFSIQFWAMHLEGLHADLSTYVSQDAACQIFINILEYSLAILAPRYKNIKPSAIRLKQLKADVLAILLYVSEMLFWWTLEPCNIFASGENHMFIRIHGHCSVLFANLIMRIAPLENLTELVLCKRQLSSKASYNQIHSWVGLIFPKLNIKNLPHFEHQEINMQIFMYLKCLLCKPKPCTDFELLLKAILVGQCRLVSLIMTHTIHDAVDERENAETFVENVFALLSCCSKPLHNLLSDVLIPWMQRCQDFNFVIDPNAPFQNLPLCIRSMLKYLAPFFKRIIEGILCIWQEVSVGGSTLPEVVKTATFLASKSPNNFNDFDITVIQHVLVMTGHILKEIPKSVIIFILAIKKICGSDEAGFILHILITGIIYLLEGPDFVSKEVSSGSSEFLQFLVSSLKSYIMTPQKLEHHLTIDKLLLDHSLSDCGEVGVMCDINLESQLLLSAVMLSHNGKCVLNQLYAYISMHADVIIKNLKIENTFIPTEDLCRVMRLGSVGYFQPYDWFKIVGNVYFNQAQLGSVTLDWKSLVKLVYISTFDATDMLAIRNWNSSIEDRDSEEEFIAQLKLLQVSTSET